MSAIQILLLQRPTLTSIIIKMQSLKSFNFTYTSIICKTSVLLHFKRTWIFHFIHSTGSCIPLITIPLHKHFFVTELIHCPVNHLFQSSFSAQFKSSQYSFSWKKPRKGWHTIHLKSYMFFYHISYLYSFPKCSHKGFILSFNFQVIRVSQFVN